MDQAGPAHTMPMTRWKKKKENLRAGDVVMMLYPGNLKNDYRLARVLKTHPDRSGLVRTVIVGYRRKNSREKTDVYKSKPLVEEQVSVQRLSLLVPNEASEDASKEVVEEPNASSTGEEVNEFITDQKVKEGVTELKDDEVIELLSEEGIEKQVDETNNDEE